MECKLDRLTIRGYKSIRSLEDFELRNLNVLIGANGSGKSNFVSFFSFLHELVNDRLALNVNKGGGADAHLFLGPQITPEMSSSLEFGADLYQFALQPTADNRLVFADERIVFHRSGEAAPVTRPLGIGHNESKLFELNKPKVFDPDEVRLYRLVSSCVVYHFHDTSATAPMRRAWSLNDYDELRPNGSNLAAFLFHLGDEEADSFALICDTIRLVAPFFKNFRLRSKDSGGKKVTELDWTQKDSDYPLHPGQFSDGTLRFIALATALLQPDPPKTILIDEPELGLHPYALNVLASLIRHASQRTQVIVSTQSVELLNAFEPEDVVVVERAEGESRFRRLSEKELSVWLEDYTLGELWQKNVTGGGPVYE